MTSSHPWKEVVDHTSLKLHHRQRGEEEEVAEHQRELQMAALDHRPSLVQRQDHKTLVVVVVGFEVDHHLKKVEEDHQRVVVVVVLSPQREAAFQRAVP